MVWNKLFSKLRMFWSKLCKSNWNCAWNLVFPLFISPIVWNMCENLHYESVYFKELRNKQEYYWPTIYRAGAAIVSTITSMIIGVHGAKGTDGSCHSGHSGTYFFLLFIFSQNITCIKPLTKCQAMFASQETGQPSTSRCQVSGRCYV